jgi:hypothetical protein
MKLKPPHKRHVKIPKKRRPIRSEAKMTKPQEMLELADTISLDDLLKFARQYDGCTHDSLIQMIHREFEIRRRVPQSSQAWCQPMDNGKHTPRTFIIYFEDRDRGIMVFDREDVARQAFEQLDTNWNCYLFGAMPDTRPDRKCK